jgi:hypothetical protein
MMLHARDRAVELNYQARYLARPTSQRLYQARLASSGTGS